MHNRSVKSLFKQLRLRAPAKINLFLRIGARRADGFHPLVSWMATVGLFDKLEVTIAPAPGIRLTLEGCGGSSDRADGKDTGEKPRAALPPVDASNLVVRAAEALARAAGISPALELTLGKVIPIGAGLGGGSSDAAHTLVALNRLWGLNWPIDSLHPIAASLGSDVPFFLLDGSALCAGRGEMMGVLPPPAAPYAVLIFPPFGLSTPAVYKRFDELAEQRDGRPGAGGEPGEMRHGDEPLEARALLASPPVRDPQMGGGPANDWRLAPSMVRPWEAWSRLNALELLPRLVNDLEAPAFSLKAELAALWIAIEKTIGRIVRMSGSGSTLFTLADDEMEARKIAETIVAKHDIPASAVELCPNIRDEDGIGASS